MKAEEFLHSTGPGQVFNPTKQDKISEMRKGYRGEIYVLSEWKSACEVPWNYNELEKTRIYLRASGDISRNVRNPTTTQPKEGGRRRTFQGKIAAPIFHQFWNLER